MTPKILGAFLRLNIIIQIIPEFGSAESKRALPWPVDRPHKVMSKAPDDRVCLLCTWERSLQVHMGKHG